jgi:hypothetical protein
MAERAGINATGTGGFYGMFYLFIIISLFVCSPQHEDIFEFILECFLVFFLGSDHDTSSFRSV